jgi:tetratricopeptide (TPR) repeat protein
MLRKVFFIFILFLSCLSLYGQAEGDSIRLGTDEMLAAQYFREGQYEKAVVIYESLFETSSAPVIYEHYIKSLFAIEEFRKAERVVRAQIRRYPGQIQYEVDLGWVADKSGNQRQSRRQFDGLISTLPAGQRQVLDLAHAFEARDYTERAIETLLHGRRLMGEAHPLHLYLAPLFERKGDYRAMMTEYVSYLEINPSEEARIRGLLQDAIAIDPDLSRNDALREVLLGRSQRYPNNSMYAGLLLWLSVQQKDFRMALMQARALDRRFMQEGELVLEIAHMSVANESYEEAAGGFKYVMDKGKGKPHYMEALTGFLDARFLAVTSSYDYTRENLLDIEKEYTDALDELGINASTVRLLRNLARLQAFYLHDPEQAISLLNQTLSVPNISQRVRSACQMELADILVLTGQVWDALLLYAQVDKTFRDDVLGHEARFKTARLSFYVGEFDWARAQLDVLKAATSRLIANDAMRLSLTIQDNIGTDGNTLPLQMYARAEKLGFMNQYEASLAVLDSVVMLFPNHPIHDDVMYAKAKIELKRGNYKGADSLLSDLLDRFPGGLLADEALLERARLHDEVFEDKGKAMQLYQKLFSGFPGSLHAATARNRFRYLRGDLIN